MVIGAPISGRWSVLTAAPDWENVDDAASDVDPVLQNEPGGGIARDDAAVAPVLGQAENVTVGEPSELGGELVALARSGRDGHGKAVLELARDDAFEPTDMVDIGNNAFGRFSRTGAIKAIPPGDMLTT